MWVLLANWVISGSDTLSVFEENIFKIKLEETTGLAASHGIEKLAVIRNLLVIGGVEENPGPKLNLYRLLRQIERSEDEMEFLRTQNLLPRTIDCCKTLGKVFPQNNPEANFKYFCCKCSQNKKVLLVKNTFFYHSNISPCCSIYAYMGFATGTYGSVSAGREFWPFRVIFFQKVERSCGQTVKDRFDFSIDSGQLYLVHSGDLNLALDNKEEEEEGGNNDEEKEEDKTNNKKEMLRIWIFSAGNSG